MQIVKDHLLGLSTGQKKNFLEIAVMNQNPISIYKEELYVNMHHITVLDVNMHHTDFCL